MPIYGPLKFFSQFVIASSLRRVTLTIAVAAISTVGGSAAFAQEADGESKEHPLKPAMAWAQRSLKAVQEAGDYSAVFSKREIINREMKSLQTQIKFRREPFSVYMRFINKDNAGREVLYVKGRNNGNLLAHEATGLASWAGTLELDPQGNMAMAESRHPITRMGMENLVSAIIRQYETEMKYGETEVKYYPDAKLDERPVLVIESRHPVPRRVFKWHVTRLWIDKETYLPVRVQQYGFPQVQGGKPVLVEDYAYTKIRTDVRLTDADFDRRNPQYQF
ncbi:DUF1571 domain-containing protein [Stratiformator vulcanicus]|uniref:Uncharacterized protein n=1 Tax=Stratiformator vulcanicus TaxID=2527980 RepID=A0A517R3N5_9PLAN|nr:DUF1571 domain-containing protein [Stratiformator vulcanicus]QDT38443.1 hypothetical protein Pan189_28370 [Stratiformator vulcanicus]